MACAKYLKSLGWTSNDTVSRALLELKEQTLLIETRMVARMGYTQRDTSFRWQWTRDGEPTGKFGITAQAGKALTLIYRATTQGQTRDYAQRLELVYTPCNFGQSSPWALCPRCGHRVAKLYLCAGQFACTQCQWISYKSQSQGALGRSWIKQRKIEAKLGYYLYVA